MDGKKYCNNPDCRQANPQLLSEFYKYKPSKDGLTARCKTCLRMAGNNYYKLHADRLNEKSKLYQKANPEKRRERDRRYREANPQKVIEARIRYRENNREKIRERNRLRKQANPEKTKAEAQRRKERISAGGDYTKREWWALCDYYDNKCLACGEQKDLTPDHIVPVCKGGRNDLSNIQPLCLECNTIKAIRVIDYRPTVPRWAN